MAGEYLPPVVTRLVGDIDDVIKKVEEVKAAIKSLKDAGTSITIDFQVDKASLARAQAAAQAAVKPITVPVRFDVNTAGLAGGAALARATGGGGRGWGWLAGLAGARVPLFGGVGLPAFLAGIGGIHLAIDLFAELAAVIIPATIALGAFGAVAAPVVQDISQRLQAMNTVVTATGQHIWPLTGAFGKLSDSIKPDVYSVYGDALDLVNRKMGTLSQVVTGTGSVISQFAARITVALGSTGMSQFMKNATSDVAGIFNIIGNIAGTLGNILHNLPGYAQVFLNVLQTLTHGLEVLTGTAPAQAIIRWGLAFHGAFLYAGLAATGFAKLIPGLLTGLGGFALKIGDSGGALARMGAFGARAATALRGFGVYAAGAAALPWGWIAVAAAAVGVLAYAMATVKDATQQWFASLEAGIGNLSASSGLTALVSGQAQAVQRLAAAQSTLAKTQAAVNAAGQQGGVTGRSLILQQAQQRQSISELSGDNQTLIDQANLYNYRLSVLAGKYGGVTNAQNLLSQSGIKMSQFLTYGRQNFNIILQQIAGLVQGYAAMGQRGGALGADLFVVNQQLGDQYQSMQKLNQAWSTFIGLTSSLQTSATGIITTLRQLTTDAGKAGASFTGVNANSITLRNDFESNLVPSLQNVIGGMRQAGDSSTTMGTVISTFLSPAVKAGALANQTMRTQIYDMARQANYTGPDAIGPLTKWINSMKTSFYNAMKQIDQTGAALNGLPKTESLNVYVHGSGSWATQYFQGASGHRVGGFAAGGRIPGYGGGDRVPAMLEPGEAIVPKHLVGRIAPFLSKHGVPGFASGGIIPGYSGNVAGLGPWAKHDYQATAQGFAASVANSVKQQMAQAFAGSTSGGNLAAERIGQAMAAAMGWTGGQWLSLKALWMRESGWNPYAVNPSSGAYGIPQSLGHGHPYALGDIPAQIAWGIQYILSRYGSPAAAWAHELGFGWYDHGGFLKPGWTMAYNGTGMPEPVGPAASGHYGGDGDIVIQLDGQVLARVTQKNARKYNRRNGPHGTNKWASPA